MQNDKFRLVVKNELLTTSRILQTIVENKIVDTISVIKLADVHERLRLNAKNRKAAITKNNELSKIWVRISGKELFDVSVKCC
jgi:hypothetical protein